MTARPMTDNPFRASGISQVDQVPPSPRTPAATFSPNSFHTISAAAKYLLTHRRLRLDLTQLSDAERKRAIDFLCGILFVTRGTVSVTNDHIYLMTI